MLCPSIYIEYKSKWILARGESIAARPRAETARVEGDAARPRAEAARPRAEAARPRANPARGEHEAARPEADPARAPQNRTSTPPPQNRHNSYRFPINN